MPAILDPVTLTEEQGRVIEQLLLGAKRQAVQTLGGYAGTGKTTVIRTLSEKLPRYAVCAYTGKATQRLRKHGLRATTMHSLIYRSIPLDDGGVRFELKDRRDEDVDFDGFLVDEASMVGRTIDAHLRSFDMPIIYVGDHGQLEPIGDDGFNLMADPQLRLEQIHRNAGPIERFANHLREGKPAEDWKEESEAVSILRPEDLNDLDLAQVDQMICAYNATRVDINTLVRASLGRDPDRPEPGDRVICLRNDHRRGIYNGTQGTIHAIKGASLAFDSEGSIRWVVYDKESFNRATPSEYKRGVLPFEYSYCLTCHKTQGDEWPWVLVLEQKCSRWKHCKWAYTGASRAKEKLSWVLG